MDRIDLPYSGATDLSDEQVASIRERSARELARRGLLGAIIYTVVILVVGWLTPLAHDFPRAFATAVLLTAVTGAARVLLLIRFDSIYPRRPNRWVRLYAIAIWIAAAAWGGIAGIVVHNYGVAWASMLTITITAGLCAGALSSMSMRIDVLWTYLGLMLLPSLVASTTLTGMQGRSLIFVFLSYLVYSMIQGRNMYRDYWEALINAIRLDAHTRQRLHDLTYRDPLTGLPNRALFGDRLNQAIRDGRRTSRLVGIMTVNLDRFMNINDTLGHESGDALLKVVSDRLTSVLREPDTLSRLGADNFALVLPNLAQARDLARVAQKVSDALAEPLGLKGLELFMTASVGIAVYPRDGEEADHLLKNAEAAMSRVKEQGGNGYQFYETEMNAQAMQRLTLETRLRRALDRNEFVLHYQPKICSESGRINGVEALLRWQPRVDELIPPAQFIPLLEDTGLIVPVGEWVLRTACSDARRWIESGFKDVTVAVNLSVRQFRDPDLGDVIHRIVRDSGLETDQIELEITESLLMDDSPLIREILARLNSLGLHLALDDFGTGYSSLGYLKHLPVSTLKIDRSFVKDATTVPADAALVRAVIALAHSLGLRVTAEGVETREHADFLAELHCDEMQGYFFSRPVPLDGLIPLLKTGLGDAVQFASVNRAPLPRSQVG